MPVIMISSLAHNSCKTAMEALEIGAVEVVAKPAGPYSIGDLRVSLAGKIRSAAAARIRRFLDVDRRALLDDGDRWFRLGLDVHDLLVCPDFG